MVNKSKCLNAIAQGDVRFLLADKSNCSFPTYN